MAFMSDLEKEWVETRRIVQATRPLCAEKAPEQPTRALLFRVITHTAFEVSRGEGRSGEKGMGEKGEMRMTSPARLSR
jgi:hypothetical protein